MSYLFSPLTIKSITLRNRIGVAPMCQYSAIDGVAQAWHMSQLGSKAVGGAGLVITEATAVLPEGRITPACMGLWNNDQVEALKPIIAFIKSQGAVAGMQLAHSGRKGSSAPPWIGGQQLTDAEGGWDTLGPTDAPFDDDGTRLWKTPKQMSQTDIDRVQDGFVAAAARLKVHWCTFAGGSACMRAGPPASRQQRRNEQCAVGLSVATNPHSIARAVACVPWPFGLSEPLLPVFFASLSPITSPVVRALCAIMCNKFLGFDPVAVAPVGRYCEHRVWNG